MPFDQNSQCYATEKYEKLDILDHNDNNWSVQDALRLYHYFQYGGRSGTQQGLDMSQRCPKNSQSLLHLVFWSHFV